MTTLSANTFSQMIISPSDLRGLLAEVERDLIGHPNFGLPTSYDWKKYLDLLLIIKNYKYGLSRHLVHNNT